MLVARGVKKCPDGLSRLSSVPLAILSTIGIPTDQKSRRWCAGHGELCSSYLLVGFFKITTPGSHYLRGQHHLVIDMTQKGNCRRDGKHIPI